MAIPSDRLDERKFRATETQVLEALRLRYDCAPSMHSTLAKLCYLLAPYFGEARQDVIELVLRAMRSHPLEYRIQMTGMWCLHKLTEGLASRIDPSVLEQTIEVTLTAMEAFPREFELQMSALHLICNDIILPGMNIDRPRCLKLVKACLSLENPPMNKWIQSACARLGEEISIAETSVLLAITERTQNMFRLLSIVRTKLQSKSVDPTMLSTLNTLWDLTNEGATTCKIFLDEGGMVLFLELLKNFRGESSIETKVLRVFSNVAEVAELRRRIMEASFVKILPSLLDSEHIDVSYFAAGIAAHLLSAGPEPWNAIHPRCDIVDPSVPTRPQLLEQLDKTVGSWKTPDHEIVKCRTFRPLFPLLRCSDARPAQFWALWAINHACTKKPRHYCEILTREGGVEILRDLEKDDGEGETQPDVLALCRSIIDTAELHPC